jgi:hypothetical protein
MNELQLSLPAPTAPVPPAPAPPSSAPPAPAPTAPASSAHACVPAKPKGKGKARVTAMATPAPIATTSKSNKHRAETPESELPIDEFSDVQSKPKPARRSGKSQGVWFIEVPTKPVSGRSPASGKSPELPIVAVEDASPLRKVQKLGEEVATGHVCVTFASHSWHMLMVTAGPMRPMHLVGFNAMCVTGQARCHHRLCGLCVLQEDV